MEDPEELHARRLDAIDWVNRLPGNGTTRVQGLGVPQRILVVRLMPHQLP